MKSLRIIVPVLVGVLLFFAGYHYLRAQGILAAHSSGRAVAVEDIQYQFEKGKGLLNVAVEDVFMGVGMITGARKAGDAAGNTAFTGSLDFEMATKKQKARVQVDGIRLIERTAGGDGRVFEPERVYDEAMEKGREPGIQFPKGKGNFPFVWETGGKGYIYYVFSDVPANVREADIVITYNAKFTGKRHASYYEDRFPVTRKVYARVAEK
ncbi:MAG TPA: hypothetical protein PLL75_07460 [Candidatus Omnitrophota bacterium]|nr:hypothetical protein [Candidatus Omnitrophota bacterium]HPS37543.1 hypothetical protein [Candidatus Omnitrophota bacterium]